MHYVVFSSIVAICPLWLVFLSLAFDVTDALVLAEATVDAQDSLSAS